MGPDTSRCTAWQKEGGAPCRFHTQPQPRAQGARVRELGTHPRNHPCAHACLRLRLSSHEPNRRSRLTRSPSPASLSLLPESSRRAALTNRRCPRPPGLAHDHYARRSSPPSSRYTRHTWTLLGALLLTHRQALVGPLPWGGPGGGPRWAPCRRRRQGRSSPAAACWRSPAAQPTCRRMASHHHQGGGLAALPRVRAPVVVLLVAWAVQAAAQYSPGLPLGYSVIGETWLLCAACRAAGALLLGGPSTLPALPTYPSARP